MIENAMTLDLREQEYHRLSPSYISNIAPVDYPAPQNTEQLVCVADGMGVDSTAVLVGLKNRGIRPDLITFANTGNEKEETVKYIETRNQWLADVGFPPLVIVQRTPPKAGYDSLYGNCYKNETLPSLAFGQKSCSIEWKKKPQDFW